MRNRYLFFPDAIPIPHFLVGRNWDKNWCLRRNQDSPENVNVGTLVLRVQWIQTIFDVKITVEEWAEKWSELKISKLNFGSGRRRQDHAPPFISGLKISTRYQSQRMTSLHREEREEEELAIEGNQNRFGYDWITVDWDQFETLIRKWWRREVVVSSDSHGPFQRVERSTENKLDTTIKDWITIDLARPKPKIHDGGPSKNHTFCIPRGKKMRLKFSGVQSSTITPHYDQHGGGEAAVLIIKTVMKVSSWAPRPSQPWDYFVVLLFIS